MSCNVGYPEKPCPYGKVEGRVTREGCGPCKNYIPPPHILQWCMLWDRDRVLCMRPKKDCETCPEKSPKSPARIGKIDWKDQVAVRKFFRDNYNPSKAKEKMMRFLEKNPTYFKNYQEANRAKVNANARRWYYKKRAKQEAERARLQQSGSKIPGDPP